jgi:hypothetical protein
MSDHFTLSRRRLRCQENWRRESNEKVFSVRTKMSRVFNLVGGLSETQTVSLVSDRVSFPGEGVTAQGNVYGVVATGATSLTVNSYRCFTASGDTFFYRQMSGSYTGTARITAVVSTGTAGTRNFLSTITLSTGTLVNLVTGDEVLCTGPAGKVTSAGLLTFSVTGATTLLLQTTTDRRPQVGDILSYASANTGQSGITRITAVTSSGATGTSGQAFPRMSWIVTVADAVRSASTIGGGSYFCSSGSISQDPDFQNRRVLPNQPRFSAPSS